MMQQVEKEGKVSLINDNSFDTQAKTNFNQNETIKNPKETKEKSVVSTQTTLNKRKQKSEQKDIIKKNQILQRQVTIEVYNNQEGHQDQNFNKNINPSQFKIGDRYTAAIESVSKQILAEYNKKQSQIIFSQKVIAQKQQRAIDSPQLKINILNSQSTRILEQKLELPEAKDGFNISYAVYHASKKDKKYYTNISAKAVLESNKAIGVLGNNLLQILENCNDQQNRKKTLCKEIKQIEKCLGGPKKAYQMKNTRVFVEQILKFVIEQSKTNNIYLDIEAKYRLFQENVKFDYYIMQSAQVQANQGDNETEQMQDTPLYAIEVKQTDDLNQHFKKLRSLCISNGLPKMYGVYINCQQWQFTRYDLQKEIEQKITGDESLSLFEVSYKFEMVDPKEPELNKQVLCQVASILEWLAA